MPKVSIILSSFNHAKYIREAIENTLNQTFTDFELIILDDGSSDNSWDLINQYSDPRIKAYRNAVNIGGIAGVNKAISEIALGEYIAIHHSDDVWELDKLGKQVAYLDAHPEIGAVFTRVQIIDEHGVKSTKDWFNQKNKTRWQWLNQLFNGQNHLCHPSVLIRKQCYQDVGVYRDGLAQTADAEMWSRVLIKFPIHIIQEKLTKHRLFSDNSNASGPRIDVAIRVSNEWNVLRENYFSITSFEDIVAIFPSLERFRTPQGFDNKFLLAMACLYECKQRNAWQLGLKWLFDLLNDKTRYKKIRELYSFTYMDFIRLTAEFDVYAVQSLAEREQSIAAVQQQQAQEIARLNAILEEKATELQVREQEVLRVYQSRWHRLGEAIKLRPVTLHNLARITYLMALLLTPLRLRQKILPLISKWRQARFKEQPQHPSTQEALSSHPYVVRQSLPVMENRPRIIHVIANFCTGGSSRLVTDLIEHLGPHYEQSVLTSFIPAPPTYVGLDISEYRFLVDEQPFVNHFSRIKPDLIHIHYWGDSDESWYANAFKAAEKLGIPVIENINTPITPYFSSAVARYVYVSNYVRQVFGRDDPFHLTIYPGSDLAHFVRSEHEPQTENCVGMVYRLEHDKLNEQSIQPFIRIAQRRPQTRVLIVGGGSLLAPFQKAVDLAGVKECFEFTGYVSYEKLPELYRRMSVFIAPVWKESFGQVSVFAMNMEIPVIGYAIGAISEILDNPQLLAPPADFEKLADIAIGLLDSAEVRARIGQQQHEKAQNHFSVQAMTGAYASLYAEVGQTSGVS